MQLFEQWNQADGAANPANSLHQRHELAVLLLELSVDLLECPGQNDAA